jgi:hypothetical protein
MPGGTGWSPGRPTPSNGFAAPYMVAIDRGVPDPAERVHREVLI